MTLSQILSLPMNHRNQHNQIAIPSTMMSIQQAQLINVTHNLKHHIPIPLLMVTILIKIL